MSLKFNNLEIFERVFSGHWFLTSYNGIGFVFDFPKIGGGDFITQIIYVMENEMCRYIFDRDEFEKGAQFTSDKLLHNDPWRKKIYGKIDHYTKAYFDAGEDLRKTDLSKLTDKQIIQRVKKIIPLQHWHQAYAVLANGMVIDARNHLSNKIRHELRPHVQGKDFEEIWSFLTQLTKMSLRQKKDYTLAVLAEESKHLSTSTVEKKLKKLHEKYSWLDYNNMGPATSWEKFQKELAEAKAENKHLNLLQELAILKKEQSALMQGLKFNARAKFLVTLAQGVIWQKGYRKDVQYHGFYCYEPLFRELAKRKGIADWHDVSFLFPWEIEDFIKDTKPGPSELRERRRFSIFVVSKEGNSVSIGTEAKDFSEKLKGLEDFSGIKEVKGQVAYRGFVKGKVKIIQTPADIPKMQKGDVLISQATSPDLLAAMKLAGAIVTNTGGLICHAAITSRELKIPCVVGSAKATLVFKDGDLVEVDAEKGVVRKL